LKFTYITHWFRARIGASSVDGVLTQLFIGGRVLMLALMRLHVVLFLTRIHCEMQNIIMQKVLYFARSG
jgi:hypothetical protein